MLDKAVVIICLLTVSQSHVSQPLPVRILNGRDAYPGEFPYRVSIQWSIPSFSSSFHFCGGAIIDKTWVLTHAECIKFIKKYITMRSIVVKAGKHDLGVIEESEQTSYIRDFHLHEYYMYDTNENRQDVGLIELDTPLQFNERVAKIELFKVDLEPTGTATISGWGGATNKKLFPDYPTILQATSVSVLTYQDCVIKLNETARKLRKPVENLLYDSNFCTEPFSDGAEPCGGDFGGPITIRNEDGLTKLVGLVHWGSLPCVEQPHPLVFVRTSFFSEWITSIVSGTATTANIGDKTLIEVN